MTDRNVRPDADRLSLHTLRCDLGRGEGLLRRLNSASMARILVAALLFSTSLFSQCVPISQASQHVGQKTCVTGKVLTVTRGEHESLNLNFCLQNAPCPFLVRVFPEDVDYVGDVRQLIGKEIEITGKIKDANGRTEMALKDADQLRGESAKGGELRWGLGASQQ